MPLSNIVLQQIDQCIDTHIYRRGSNAGKYFWQAYGKDGKNQASNLKNRACQSNRFSELVTYVKNQVGKEKRGGWVQQINVIGSPQTESFGRQVIGNLQAVREKVRRHFRNNGEDEEFENKIQDIIEHIELQVRTNHQQWQAQVRGVNSDGEQMFQRAQEMLGVQILRDLNWVSGKVDTLQYQALGEFDYSFHNALNQGEIDDNLCAELRERHGVLLSANATVEVARQNQEWKISENGENFVVTRHRRRDGAVLSIEREMCDPKDPKIRSEARLRLVRAYIDALVSQYMYEIKINAPQGDEHDH